MAFTPEQHREYRERLRHKGLCPICRKRPRKTGRRQCETCLARDNQYKRRQYAERIDRGLCIRCGDPLTENEKETGQRSHYWKACQPSRIWSNDYR